MIVILSCNTIEVGKEKNKNKIQSCLYSTEGDRKVKVF